MAGHFPRARRAPGGSLSLRGPGLAVAPQAPWRRLAVGALALHLLAWPALPITSNDAFSNLAYGRMARLGLDTTRSGPSVLVLDDPFGRLVSPRWRDTPSVYGPLGLAPGWWAAGAASVLGALVRFKLAMLMATLAIAGVAFGFAQRLPAPENKRRALLLAPRRSPCWERPRRPTTMP